MLTKCCTNLYCTKLYYVNNYYMYVSAIREMGPAMFEICNALSS